MLEGKETRELRALYPDTLALMLNISFHSRKRLFKEQAYEQR